jgi:prepilin-type N-terminal cleavage/methylation domain-containing protein
MKSCDANGFTLIEVIMVVLLIGIISVFSFLFIVTGVSGYVTAKENAELAQKVGLAMARISKEFAFEMKDIQNLDLSTEPNIQYSYTESPAGLRYRHLALVKTEPRKSIVLVPDDIGDHSPDKNDDEILLPNVSSLAFTFTDYDGNEWKVGDGFENLAEIMIILVVFLSDTDDTTQTFQLIVHPAGDEDLISMFFGAPDAREGFGRTMLPFPSSNRAPSDCRTDPMRT